METAASGFLVCGVCLAIVGVFVLVNLVVCVVEAVKEWRREIKIWRVKR